MDTSYYTDAISEWIAWTEKHCHFTDDHMFVEDAQPTPHTPEYSAPWIDDLGIALDHNGLVNGSFQMAVETILAADPSNLRARYAILDYLKTIIEADEWIGVAQDIESAKDEARNLLEYILPLAPIDKITTWPQLAWEISQAGLISNLERAQKLFERALYCNLAPREQVYLLRARHLFLALNYPIIAEILKDQFNTPISFWRGEQIWHPSFASGTLTQIMLYGAISRYCHNPSELRADFQNEDKALLWQVIADIKLTSGQKVITDFDAREKRFLEAIVLPASYYMLGEYTQAAEEYRRNLPQLSAGQNTENVPILRSIALCYKSAGDLSSADSYLQQILKEYPDEKGIRLERAEICRLRADFEGAYLLLREECELDPTISDQPHASLALALGGKNLAIQSEVGALFLEKHPEISSLIDALHQEYWPTYAKLSNAARRCWREGTVQLYFFSQMMPGRHTNSTQAAVVQFSRATEHELRELYLAFRAHIGNSPNSLPPLNQIEQGLQGKFLKQFRFSGSKFCLTLGEMLGILKMPESQSIPFVNQFHKWIHANHPSIFDVLDLIDAVNKVRAPATHGTIELMDIGPVISNCRKILDGLKTKTREYV